jgi:arylsulfatase A-like enzyme
MRLAAILTLVLAACAAAAETRPNVILIMTDDQGYGDLSITGNTVLQTPHIDRLAREGVWLKRFYVSPVCTPTRASLMTGRYHLRTRAIDTYIGRAMMEPDEVTVAEVLRDAGYATGIFGKWHLGDCYPLRAMDQGFTESLVHKGGGLRQPSNPPEGDSYFDPILWHNGKPVRTKGFCTDIYFDAAMQFIESRNKAGQPFVAYIPTNAPHGPLDEVPQADYERYKGRTATDGDARIFAMIANIDSNIGRVLDKLDELKIADNTLIMYLHDNGPQHDPKGPRYNAGLRSGKASIFEGGIRTPLFARWPGKIQPGRASDIHAAHIDIMPTILAACGVDAPASVRFDGQNIFPLMQGGKVLAKDRTIFAQWHRGDVPVLYHNFAAITERWKLLNDTNAGSEKLPGEPNFQLFDLLADPGETKNIAAEHPQIVADLKKQYEQWFADVSSTRPDNYAPPRIVIGHRGTSPVILTPQDIRAGGPGRGGWDVPGAWLLHVQRPGTYTVRFRLRGPQPQSTTARLRVGPIDRQLEVGAGASEAVFENVTLPAGDAELSATLDEENRRWFQVDVMW